MCKRRREERAELRAQAPPGSTCLSRKEKGLCVLSLNRIPSKISSPIYKRPFDRASNRSLTHVHQAQLANWLFEKSCRRLTGMCVHWIQVGSVRLLQVKNTGKRPQIIFYSTNHTKWTGFRDLSRCTLSHIRLRHLRPLSPNRGIFASHITLHGRQSPEFFPQRQHFCLSARRQAKIMRTVFHVSESAKENLALPAHSRFSNSLRSKFKELIALKIFLPKRSTLKSYILHRKATHKSILRNNTEAKEISFVFLMRVS